jgi:hypothetical protein
LFKPGPRRPFVYPRGWAYRRWAIGAVLPPLFLAPAYFYSGWAALGLAMTALVIFPSSRIEDASFRAVVCVLI